MYLAGLGTVGIEIYEQVPKLDAVLVPAAGQYGLLAGTAAAVKHLNPQILVIVSLQMSLYWVSVSIIVLISRTRTWRLLVSQF